MALTVKGSRLITVDGAVYRWRMRRKPSYSQECLGSPLTFAVELAGARGSILSVTIPDAGRPDSLVLAARRSLIVRPALVAAVIQAALDRGWGARSPRRPVPAQPGPRRPPGRGQDGNTPDDPWLRL